MYGEAYRLHQMRFEIFDSRTSTIAQVIVLFLKNAFENLLRDESPSTTGLLGYVWDKRNAITRLVCSKLYSYFVNDMQSAF